MPSNVTAICPGTFDPVTVGHLDIITRGATKFGRVIVGLIEVPQRKSPLFGPEEREEFLRNALAGHDKSDTRTAWATELLCARGFANKRVEGRAILYAATRKRSAAIKLEPYQEIANEATTWHTVCVSCGGLFYFPKRRT
jgi:cytidyltransferase-like protein